MRKKLLPKLLLSASLAISCFALFGQLVEAPLSNAQGGAPHYSNGTFDDPGKILDDPFVYNPNNLISDSPFNTHDNSNQQLFDARGEIVVENPHTSPTFPTADDSTWVSMDVSIPAGKELKAIHFWARDDNNQINWFSGVVVILESAGARFTSSGIDLRDDMRETSDGPLGTATIDLTTLGVTDNLLTGATKIIITRANRTKNVFIVAEVRAAAGDLGTLPPGAPALSEVTTGDLVLNRDLVVSSDQDGTIYIVPDGTASDKISIQQAQVMKWGCDADSVYSRYMDQNYITPGDYDVYCLGKNDLLSAGESITIVPDNAGTIISNLTSGSFIETSYLKLKMNERATVYLVPEGTATDTASIRGAALRELTKGNLEDELLIFETYRVGSGQYVLHAIDVAGNASAASATITLTGKPTVVLEELELDSSMVKVGNNHYGTTYQLAHYMLNDDFPYNPNSPTDPKPNQLEWEGDTTGWHGSTATPDSQYVEIRFELPVDKQLDVLDIWNRKQSDSRMHNLGIILANDDTSWTSYPWSGCNPIESATLPGYGRFEFNTADSMPPGLLRTANYLKLYHTVPDILNIMEIRLAYKDRDNEAPVADAGEAQNVEAGATVQLDGSGSYDADGDEITYQWLAPGVTLSDATIVNPTFTAPESGIITAILKVNDGRVDSEPVTVEITVGGTSVVNTKLQGVSIYPNPSSEGFNINLSNVNSETTIELRNVTGQLVYKTTAQAGAVHAIESSSVEAKGLYFITITSEGKQLIEKLIVD